MACGSAGELVSNHPETAESSSLLDLLSFKRQQTVFIVLNLLLLAALLLMHWSLASFWGNPSSWLMATVGLVFLVRIPELLWVRGLSRPIQPAIAIAVTWASILLNVALTILLSDLTNHEDSPYIVLLFLPVLEAAFRLRLSMLIGVIVASDFAAFFWQWRFFVKHPPVDVGEYIEAGTTSLMLAVVGVLVWLVVRDLRRKETHLANNLVELEQAREKLLHEEKLAAMGRLSSAIAHEIRNPVAMIASSIATAKQSSGAEREEMFEIASDEAGRLSPLTTEFLDYASTRRPQVTVTSIADTVAYVADASRAHASQKGLKFELAVSRNSAGTGRCGPTAAGPDESGAQCRGCVAGGRHDRPAGPGGKANCLGRGGEFRGTYSRVHPGAHVRAFLHHQTSRDRPGTGHCAQYCPRPGWRSRPGDEWTVFRPLLPDLAHGGRKRKALRGPAWDEF